VRPQTVRNKSERLGEAGKNDENPDMLAKNSFTDFIVEHACFIAKFN
jgi:hypothetical protein